MSYSTPRFTNRGSNKVLQLFDGYRNFSLKRLFKDVESNFDELYVPTDIEVYLFDDWSGVAYRPRSGSNDMRWAYKIYKHDELKDCGFVNLKLLTVDSRGHIHRQHIRELTNMLTDVVYCYRQDGSIPKTYGTSMLN